MKLKDSLRFETKILRSSLSWGMAIPAWLFKYIPVNEPAQANCPGSLVPTQKSWNHSRFIISASILINHCSTLEFPEFCYEGIALTIFARSNVGRASACYHCAQHLTFVQVLFPLHHCLYSDTSTIQCILLNI